MAYPAKGAKRRLSEHAEMLPEPLCGTLGQRLAYNQAVGALGRYSMVTVTADILTVHRLVQTVVRITLTLEQQHEWAGSAVRLVNAAFPPASEEVANWPACGVLLPHVLAVVDHAQGMEVELQAVAGLCSKAGVYLWSRGQYRQAQALMEQALAGYRRIRGNDHPTYPDLDEQPRSDPPASGRPRRGP
jgi:Tetratricopeptide repeat